MSLKKSVLGVLGLCLAVWGGMSASVYAEDATTSSFTPQQRQEIESIVQEYLLANPELLAQMAQALEQEQLRAQEDALDDAIAFFKADSGTPYRGKQDAKHYLIEFFDYNCGYCKVVRPLTKRLAQENDLRTIYIEFPILSPVSVRASAIGLGLFAKDKELYFKYQDYLMSKEQRITSEAQLKEAVEAAGGNFEEIVAFVKDNTQIQNALAKNLELGQSIGVRGTPFFILDGQVIRGAVRDYESLESLLKK